MLRSNCMSLLKVLGALMGRHLLRGQSMRVVYDLGWCALWSGMGLTVVWIMPRTRLAHRRMYIGIIH